MCENLKYCFSVKRKSYKFWRINIFKAVFILWKSHFRSRDNKMPKYFWASIELPSHRRRQQREKQGANRWRKIISTELIENYEKNGYISNSKVFRFRRTDPGSLWLKRYKEKKRVSCKIAVLHGRRNRSIQNKVTKITMESIKLTWRV